MQSIRGILHLSWGSHTKYDGLHVRDHDRVQGNWRSPGLQQGSKGLPAGPEAATGTCTQCCSTWKLCGVGMAKRSRAEQSLERLHRRKRPGEQVSLST